MTLLLLLLLLVVLLLLLLLLDDQHWISYSRVWPLLIAKWYTNLREAVATGIGAI